MVLMSEIIDGLRNMFEKWKEAFVCKGLKVNLWKNKWSLEALQRMACLRVNFSFLGFVA